MQVLCAGAPAQLNAAVLLTAAADVSSSGYIAEEPLDTVIVVAPAAANEKSTPVPSSAAVCTPVGALSTRVTEPVRVPASVGAKTPDRVQAAPACRETPQVVAAR